MKSCQTAGMSGQAGTDIEEQVDESDLLNLTRDLGQRRFLELAH